MVPHKVKIRPESPTQWQGHCVISHTVPMQRNVWFIYQKNYIRQKQYIISNKWISVTCSSTMLTCLIQWLEHFLKDYFYRCYKPWVVTVERVFGEQRITSLDYFLM